MLTLSDQVGLELGEATTDGTSLLGAHIQRLVLLVLVKFSNFLALLLSHNGENTGDGLTNMTAKNKICRKWASDTS